METDAASKSNDVLPNTIVQVVDLVGEIGTSVQMDGSGQRAV